MKILWLTVDRSHRIASHFDCFRSFVEKIADVTTLKKYPAGDKGQNMWQLSRNLITGKTKTENILTKHLETNSDYDFIFCDAFFSYLEENWMEVDIPKAIFIEDVHEAVPKHQIKVARRCGIRTIFHRSNFAFHKFHPAARMQFNCIWLPHSIDMSRFNRDLERDKEVLHVGVYTQQFYPWRNKVVETLRGKPYFTIIERPKEAGPRVKKWPIDSDYDNLLSSSKICITGGSIFAVPVQKYVEIPGSGALLMSNWFPDLGLMGFVPGKNMVAYSMEDIEETVENTLKDSYKLEMIAKEGLELILAKHTSEIRAMQFINFICELIGKHKEFPTIPPCSFQVNFDGEAKTKVVDMKARPKVRNSVISGTDWRARIAPRYVWKLNEDENKYRRALQRQVL